MKVSCSKNFLFCLSLNIASVMLLLVLSHCQFPLRAQNVANQTARIANPFKGALFDSQALKTISGNALINELFKYPHINVAHIIKKQEALKLLIKNEHILLELVTILTELKEAEQSFYRMCDYPSSIYLFGFPLEAEESVLKNQWGLYTQYGFFIGLAAGYTYFLQRRFSNMTWSAWMSNSITQLSGLRLLTSMFLFWQMPFTMARSAHKTAQALHNYLQPLQQLFSAYKKLYALLSHHKALKHTLVQYDRLEQFIKNPEALSDDVKKLLRLLKMGKLKKKTASSSSLAYLIAANTLFERVKNELLITQSVVGEVDVACAVAKKMSQAGTGYPFCFVECADVETDHPFISIEELWNPANTTQPNFAKIEIGVTDNKRHLVLTGQQLATNDICIDLLHDAVLLAQVFGIAPAKSMRFTPFARIQHIKGMTHLSANQSVYAEKEMLDQIDKESHLIGAHEWSLLLVGPVLTSAKEYEGQAYLTQWMKKRGKNDQELCIVNTPFEIPLNEESLALWERASFKPRNEGASFVLNISTRE